MSYYVFPDPPSTPSSSSPSSLSTSSGSFPSRPSPKAFFARVLKPRASSVSLLFSSLLDHSIRCEALSLTRSLSRGPQLSLSKDRHLSVFFASDSGVSICPKFPALSPLPDNIARDGKAARILGVDPASLEAAGQEEDEYWASACKAMGM